MIYASNSLAPGRYDSNLKDTIFKLILQNKSLGTSSEIAQVNATQPYIGLR